MASTWWKLADENYVNADNCKSIYGISVSGHYELEIEDDDGVGQRLYGQWTTAAGARAAMQRLTQGLDPSIFGDED